MNQYSKALAIRWSDLDPNFHVRHSVYYDFGAYVRMCFLDENGLPGSRLIQLNLGPILFREECVFKKEIHFGDLVTIDLQLKKCTPNYSRWTFEHHIFKNSESVAAVITVDGAWMDIAKRRLTVPTEQVSPTFDLLPRASDFHWIEKKSIAK